MAADSLGAATKIKVEVWDWDMAGKNDLIGEATFDLPNVHDMIGRGDHRGDVPPLLLSLPKAKEGSKSRGAVEGSFTLLEKSDMKDRTLASLRQQIEEKDREIAHLRAQLGMAPKPIATTAAQPNRRMSSVAELGAKEVGRVQFVLRGKVPPAPPPPNPTA